MVGEEWYTQGEITPDLINESLCISLSMVVVLMEACNAVHDCLCTVDLVQVDQTTRTNPREVMVLPIVIRYKLYTTMSCQDNNSR